MNTVLGERMEEHVDGRAIQIPIPRTSTYLDDVVCAELTIMDTWHSTL